MADTILTPRQKAFLKLFTECVPISNSFYLTGGTALNEFYLPYRLSEDLDFFSLDEVDSEAVLIFLKSIKQRLNYKGVDFNTSFNRQLVFLNFGEEVLKLEFTYFPFPQLEKPKIVDGLKVDSLLDIAVNKLFTIYQNPRSRDFMDLFMIEQNSDHSMEDLVKKAKLKFDWHVDPIKLGAQFLQAKELKDYPRLINLLDHQLWQRFFKEEAKKLKKEIFQD